MARFGRSKSRSRPKAPTPIETGDEVPTEINKQEVKPLSPKNDWVSNVQALKKELQEKSENEIEKRKRKELSITVDKVVRSAKHEAMSPSSAKSKSVFKSPSAPKSPGSTKSQQHTPKSSPKHKDVADPSSPKSFKSDGKSPRSHKSDVKSPKSVKSTKSVKSGKSAKSGKSVKSAKSHRSKHEEQTFDFNSLKDVKLSKSAKRKSSKKYSSSMNPSVKNQRHGLKSTKAEMSPQDEKTVPMKVEESPLKLKERVETPQTTKRETVLSVMAEPTGSHTRSLELDKSAAESTIVSGLTQKTEKRGWFGFRKGRNRDATPKTSEEVKTARSPLGVLTGLGSISGTNMGKSISPSEATRRSMVDEVRLTSPLQLQLWLGAVKSCVVRTTVESDEASILDMEPANDIAEANNMPAPGYYKNTQDFGVYVDYSTFDDGESVSSIDLLFKWLTCRDLGDVRQRTKSNPEGMLVDDQEIVDSDVSFDVDAQPRRRVLFSP